jgi:hypothetical protein
MPILVVFMDETGMIIFQVVEVMTIYTVKEVTIFYKAQMVVQANMTISMVVQEQIVLS